MEKHHMGKNGRPQDTSPALHDINGTLPESETRVPLLPGQETHGHNCPKSHQQQLAFIVETQWNVSTQLPIKTDRFLLSFPMSVFFGNSKPKSNTPHVTHRCRLECHQVGMPIQTEGNKLETRASHCWHWLAENKWHGRTWMSVDINGGDLTFLTKRQLLRPVLPPWGPTTS